MHPVGIGETLRQAITKLVMREAGGQAKMACGSLQLCEGIEASTEGATHAVDQRRWERNVLVPEGAVDEVLKEKKTEAAGGMRM